ncbi:P27 family phage terminase small subunit [Paraburkholderia saeva]|uniref:Phage terminase small subunit P27 family n=1 Tax=Paraburkholderia saeva TaxID=2777537 RepID=A0A9N8RYC8_9BURK|nr:P27 family phage terminase small subunit [Paraburkholderia saeva]CAG4906189.1 hypothetical protein LMG31841_03533 [Paraburkholderia saeva]
MASNDPPMTVIPGAAGSVGSDAVDDVSGQIPAPPGVKFTPRERKVWEYICARLRDAQLEHQTAGIAISMVVRTYVGWLEAEEKLREVEAANDGSHYIKTPNGHEQPHQAFYVSRNLRAELLKWLPECCLTLPSIASVRSKLGEQGQQDDLFNALAGHARSHPSGLNS